MKKNIVQDVVPPKKSIRNVELSSLGRTTAKEVKSSAVKDDPFARSISIKKEGTVDTTKITSPELNNKATPPPPISPRDFNYKYEYPDTPKRSKKWLYTSAFLLIIAIVFGISALFKNATIKVSPKQEVKTLSETFTAKKDATGNNLGFQVVTVTKELERALDASVATTEQKVDKKAKGQIIIYNNYSTDSQKLVATTRFQTPEGLIFRIIDPVTIPGKTVKDGKTIAGSVEVTVEADKSGVIYNIGLKDFTIPGFKGDPKYTQIYARSKTEMTGGFSGMQKVVPKTVLDKADAEIADELKVTLSKDITSQIPADFVLFTDSLSYKFDPVVQVNSTTGGAILKKKGVASVLIFDKGSLTRAIVSKVLPDSSNDILKITNLDSLKFAFENPSTSANVATSVTFTLKGEPSFVWVFDENKLKSDLLGLSKNDANRVLQTYTAVKEAWIETSPFWYNSIPKNQDNVKLLNTSDN